MSASTWWPWITLALLGAWHGLNPGMGWLFAVSRGLQERRGAAVAGALPPIALGHALAIALALVVLAIGRVGLTTTHLRWATAAILIGFGVSKLIKHRHPRWVGMRIGFGGLTLWSFLMATAHGAGLMLVPLFLVGANEPSCHARASAARLVQSRLAVVAGAHRLGRRGAGVVKVRYGGCGHRRSSGTLLCEFASCPL